jgi:hypothetical protein
MMMMMKIVLMRQQGVQGPSGRGPLQRVIPGQQPAGFFNEITIY